MKIITIQNEFLKVDVSTFGAEIVGVEKDGKNRIWHGDESIWARKCPVLFPICGKLLDNYYVYKNQTYNLSAHGFAKDMDFEVVSHEKTSLTLLLLPTEETKKVYPFNFEFRVHFKLIKDKLGVYYIVENKGNEKMYFNVGCHESYALDGKLEDYSILLEKDDKLSNIIYGDNCLEDDAIVIELKDNKLQLSLDYFKGEFMRNGKKYVKDSLIFENIKSKNLTLYKGDEPVLDLYYNDFDNLVLWTRCDGYVAIEPWNGILDYSTSNHKLEDKKMIDSVEPKEAKTFYHSITFY